MAMTFTFHEYIEFGEGSDYYEMPRQTTAKRTVSDNFHLFAQKMTVPEFEDHINRSRLTKLLENSLAQIGATLVCGRTETGKTALAAEFAKNFGGVAWLKIDATETDWNLFARYIIEIFGEDFRDYAEILNTPHGQSEYSSEQIALFTEALTARVAAKSDAPLLVVFDDFHNIFDAEWFADFFVGLLYARAPHVKLLMLSRVKPPQPLWRLRSKQVLGVLDEKVLMPDSEEVREIVRQSKVSPKLASKAEREARGKISSVRKFVNSL